MGNTNSTPGHAFRPEQLLVLTWGRQLISVYTYTNLLSRFPLFRHYTPSFPPRTRICTGYGPEPLPVIDMGVQNDGQLAWTHPDLVDRTVRRYGGYEITKLAVTALLRRDKEPEIISQYLTDKFHQRWDTCEEPHGEWQKSVSGFLDLMESFTRVSIETECLDYGTEASTIRKDLEIAYLRDKIHIRQHIASTNDCLRFLRIGDAIQCSSMIQDFTLPVLSSLHIIFPKYVATREKTHHLLYNLYGEVYKLSSRLCSFLTVEHDNFLKRKESRESPYHDDIIELSRHHSVLASSKTNPSVFLAVKPELLKQLAANSVFGSDAHNLTDILGADGEDYQFIQIRAVKAYLPHSMTHTPAHSAPGSGRNTPTPPYGYGVGNGYLGRDYPNLFVDHSGYPKRTGSPFLTPAIGVERDGYFGGGRVVDDGEMRLSMLFGELMDRTVKEERKVEYVVPWDGRNLQY